MSCSSRDHRDHPSGVPGSAHRDNKTSNKTCRVTPGCNVPKNRHLWVHSTNTADYSEHYYALSSLGWPNDRSRWGQSSLSVLPVSRMARCKVRLALHLRHSTLLRALPSLLLRRSNSPCREAAVCRSWMPLGPLSQSADSNHSRSTQEAPKKARIFETLQESEGSEVAHDRPPCMPWWWDPAIEIPSPYAGRRRQINIMSVLSTPFRSSAPGFIL